MHLSNWRLSVVLQILIIGFELRGMFLSGGGLLAFYYYTETSNVMCAIYFTGSIIWTIRGGGRDGSAWHPLWKNMMTMGIAVTMVIANTMLWNNPLDPSLLYLHMIVPLLVILHAALFDVRGIMKPWYPPLWLAFPLLYFVYVEFHAAYIHDGAFGMRHAPYPFLDTNLYGVQTVAWTVFRLIALFVAFGYLVYFLDCVLARFGRKKDAQPEKGSVVQRTPAIKKENAQSR